MEERATVIKAGISGFGGFIFSLIGWQGIGVIIFVVLMFLDWVTGTVSAGHNAEWSSAKAKRGIAGKAMCLAVLCVAALFDWVIFLALTHVIVDSPFSYVQVVFPMVLLWYILSEMGSILENVVSVNDNTPAFLVNIIKVAKTKVSKKAEDVLKDIYPDKEDPA